VRKGFVKPAQAGIHLRFCWKANENLDSGLRRNDERKSRLLVDEFRTLSVEPMVIRWRCFMFESWRGVVGDIKPTHRPGSLEEFIKLLPDGIGVIPLTVGISSGTEQEFHAVLADYQQKAAQLAELRVDLISIAADDGAWLWRRREDR